MKFINIVNFYMPLAAQVPLMQALGTAAGIVAVVAWLICFGALIGALIAGLSERHVGGAKNALTISAVAAMAGSILTSLWIAGGMPAAPQIGAVN